jgi:hypothetical protein
MSPALIGLLVFAATFGGALGGIWLRQRLPAHHTDADSQSTVKVGIGLIATMTALVLGLVTASAKSSYDTLDLAVKNSAAEVLSLDRILARYGPEGQPVREALRAAVAFGIEKNWPENAGSRPMMHPTGPARPAEELMRQIRALPETNDEQGWLKSHALEAGEDLLNVRWAMVSAIGPSVPVPFLIVLVFWLLVTFSSFGLFAPRNGTVIAVLLVCALSVASAIFLILEMDGPFAGLIRISPKPMLYALSQIAQ